MLILFIDIVYFLTNFYNEKFPVKENFKESQSANKSRYSLVMCQENEKLSV